MPSTWKLESRREVDKRLRWLEVAFDLAHTQLADKNAINVESLAKFLTAGAQIVQARLEYLKDEV